MCIASLVSGFTAGQSVARSGVGWAGGTKALSRTVPKTVVDRGAAWIGALAERAEA